MAVAVDVQFLHQDIHRSTAKGNVYILTKKKKKKTDVKDVLFSSLSEAVIYTKERALYSCLIASYFSYISVCVLVDGICINLRTYISVEKGEMSNQSHVTGKVTRKLFL